MSIFWKLKDYGFDNIWGFVLDPMHNLFLGVMKKLFSMWFTDGHAYSLTQYESEINKDISNFVIPSDFSRPPRAITESTHYKADEWKNWLLYFGDVLLIDRLPQQHYDNFIAFIHTIALLMSNSISLDTLAAAESKLNEFVENYEKIYGKDKMVLNIHSLLHLPVYVKKFGPIHTFWCFPLESLLGLHKAGIHGTRLVEEAYFQFAAFSNYVGNLERNLFYSMEQRADENDQKVLKLLHQWKSATIVSNLQSDTEFKSTRGFKSSYPRYNITELIPIDSITDTWKFHRGFWKGLSLSNNSTTSSKSNSVVWLRSSIGIIQQFYRFHHDPQRTTVLILINEYDIIYKTNFTMIDLSKGRTKYIKVTDLCTKGILLTSAPIKMKYGNSIQVVRKVQYK